jgi:hypothetical protein
MRDGGGRSGYPSEAIPLEQSFTGCRLKVVTFRRLRCIVSTREISVPKVH